MSQRPLENNHDNNNNTNNTNNNTNNNHSSNNHNNSSTVADMQQQSSTTTPNSITPPPSSSTTTTPLRSIMTHHHHDNNNNSTNNNNNSNDNNNNSNNKNGRKRHTRSQSVSFSEITSFSSTPTHSEKSNPSLSPFSPNYQHPELMNHGHNNNNNSNGNDNSSINNSNSNGGGGSGGAMIRTMSHQQLHFSSSSSSSSSSLTPTKKKNNENRHSLNISNNGGTHNNLTNGNNSNSNNNNNNNGGSSGGGGLTHSMSISSGLRLGTTLVNRKTTIGRASHHKKPKMKDETFETVDYYTNFEMVDEDEDEDENIEDILAKSRNAKQQQRMEREQREQQEAAAAAAALKRSHSSVLSFSDLERYNVNHHDLYDEYYSRNGNNSNNSNNQKIGTVISGSGSSGTTDGQSVSASGGGGGGGGHQNQRTSIDRIGRWTTATGSLNDTDPNNSSIISTSTQLDEMMMMTGLPSEVNDGSGNNNGMSMMDNNNNNNQINTSGMISARRVGTGAGGAISSSGSMPLFMKSKSFADLSRIEKGIGAVVLGRRNATRLSEIGERASQRYDSYYLRTKYYFRKYVAKNMSLLSVSFLALLAICCALMNITLDFIIHRIEIARNTIYDLTPWFTINFIIYVLFCLSFSVLATGCVHLISGESPGSGVPEMKSILSGNMMERYLNIKTMVAKYLGILSGIGAGFPAARYGPSVHLSGCICNQLLKLRPFGRLNKNEMEKMSMLSAACAAGVAGAIGSPFGGVLFTIEVTSNYYKLENMWRAIFCSLVGSMFFYTWRQTGLLGNTEPTLYSTKFKPLSYKPKEYFLFAGIGIICGLLSALFIYVFHKLVRLRQTFSLVGYRRYLMVACVSLITAILSFSMYPLLFASSNRVMNQFFGINHLDQDKLFLRLVVFIVQKFCITIAIATMPVTSGVFGPSMMIGAALGRLIGETTAFFWPDVVPGGYAVVGAAALGAAVTRTLSPIVVMFEMTGQLSFMVPTMIASVIAVGVGDLFNKSIYDTLVYLRGLPYLGSIRNVKSYKLTAADIMKTNLDWISLDMNVEELIEVLNTTNHLTYPVVEDNESMNFLGSASRRQLLTYIDKVLHHGNAVRDTCVFEEKLDFPIDESAFSIAATTRIGKVHFLIQMVGLSHAWVLSRRKLVGVVTKKDLIKAKL